MALLQSKYIAAMLIEGHNLITDFFLVLLPITNQGLGVCFFSTWKLLRRVFEYRTLI